MRHFSAYRIVVVLAVVALAAVIFLNGFGTFHTDIKPELYVRPRAMLSHYLSPWTSSPYLGSPNFNVGLVPVLAVLAMLREIGLSPEITFKVLHFGLYFAGAVGLAKLARYFVPNIGRWGQLIAAVLFVANPYAISAGATLAILLPMAVLPWQILCFVHALKRPQSWAWPALFGLTFFLMSGMNVAVVPVLGLLALVPVVAAAIADRMASARDTVVVLGKSALFVIGVSIYWLVPAASAIGTGNQIIEGSETLSGIAKVSSMTEVLRGLGLWPLYGSSSMGPWVPEHAVYVMSPLIMMLTILWPALGLLGLRWANEKGRIFIAVAIFISAFIAVGVFPAPDRPASPLGSVLRELFEIPLLAAFRTTNKIGAILMIALAIGVAIAAIRIVPRAFNFGPTKFTTVVLTATLFAAWSLPAISGNLYISPLEIPDYWKAAAKSVDESSQPGTVLVLPGQVRPNYRWTKDRPDDVLNSVMARRAVLPETTPNSSPPAVNFLAALDGSFQSGTSSDELVSTMARYLGAGQVLLRHDVVWEDTGGARPAQTSQQIGSDPGLFGRENFGKNGQNTLSPAMEDPFFFGEQFLPPLQVYDVSRASNPVRAMGLGGSLLVAGDGFAFPALTDAGMLARTPVVRYAHDLDGKEFAAAVRQSSRLVLTDTNARRNVVDTRLTAGQGPLLRAKEALSATRTLGENPNDQTVREDEIVSVTTSSAGGVFFDLPYGSGDFAFDGDLATGWRFGDFGRGEGETITARFDEPTVVNDVAIAQLPIGSQKIDRVLVTVGGVSEEVRLPDSGVVNVKFDEVTSDYITVEVKELRGEGFNFVGIAEINVNGLHAETVGRLPLTFQDRWKKLSTADRESFARTPLDVLLTRVQNTVQPTDDSETALDRRWELPQERTYDVRARIRIGGDLEPLYDRLDGFGDEVTFHSSGYYFDDPRFRASAATNGKKNVGWIPGGGTRDAWWEATGPKRQISTIVFEQAEQPKKKGEATHRISRVRVELDGKTVTEKAVRMGHNVITLDKPRNASKVRLVVTGVSGDPTTLPPMITTIDTGFSLVKLSGSKPECLDVAVLDEGVLRMRPTDRTLAGPNELGTWWKSCGKQTLAAGEHRVRQANNFIIDSMHWKDVLDVPTSAAVTPAAKVNFDRDGKKRITVLGASGPYAVVAGQGYNPKWRASINGKDLGPAQVLNGFSSGWVVPDGRAGVVDIVYGPQRTANLALGVSGLFLLAILVLVVREVRSERFLTVANQHVTAGPTWWGRLPHRQRQIIAVVSAVLLAGFVGGWAGLAAAAVLIAVQRLEPLEGRTWVWIGSLLVLLSMLVHLIVLWRADLLGEVSADSIALSMWPHSLATVGLLWAVAGAIFKLRGQGATDE